MLKHPCQRMLTRLPSDRMYSMAPIRKGEYVFPNSKGKWFVNFTHYWYRIRKKSGLDEKGYRFHDLRHTFANHLASSGEVDISTLKELLRHRSIEMTQRYAHLTNGSLRPPVLWTGFFNSRARKRNTAMSISTAIHMTVEQRVKDLEDRNKTKGPLDEFHMGRLDAFREILDMFEEKRMPDFLVDDRPIDWLALRNYQ